MKIGIDLNPLVYTKTGIGVYVQHLMTAMAALGDGMRWYFPVKTPVPVKALYHHLIKKRIGNALQSRLEIDPTFSLFDVRRRANETAHLGSTSIDLFHITNAQSAFNSFEVPFAITVHDLAWKKIPENDLQRPNVFGLEHLEQLIRRADHVISVSDSTRDDVIELLGRKPEDVTTAHLAARSVFFPPESNSTRFELRKKLNDGQPFFLSLSTIEPRKNYLRTLDAFRKFSKDHPAYRWVICGAKRASWPQLRDEIKRHSMESRVIVKGHVPDAMVRELLTASESLLYPSLYEGFGLPALEAMQCGTPVICSAAGSLREVVGDNATIVDPKDSDSIFQGMCELADQNKRERSELRQRVIDHAKGFSWERNAQTTLSVYRKIASRDDTNSKST